MKRKMKSRILIACLLFGIISITGCKGKEEKSADFIIMSTENENNTQENKNSDTAEKNVATTLQVEGKEVKATTYKDKSGFSVVYCKEMVTPVADSAGVTFQMENNSDAYLSISKIDDMSYQEVLEGIVHKEKLEEDIQLVRVGKGNYPAQRLVQKVERQSKKSVEEYYALENNGSVFLIELKYESASEKEGAYFKEMLKSFDWI